MGLSVLGIALAFFCLSAVSPVNTFWNNNPPWQPGFPQKLSGDRIHESGVTLFDLDGDPSTQEILIAGYDRSGTRGVLYAYRPNGSLYWEAPLRAPINSTPAVADIDGDGVPEVMVGLGGVIGAQSWHGGLVAVNGRTGAVKWIFDTQDWIFHRQDGWLDGVYSSPAVGDVDADGEMEIVFGAWDQCIYLLNKNGQPEWGELNKLGDQSHCGGHGFYNEDTIWSSAALADLTGNGKLEIIIGADITSGNRYGDPSGGYVYVLDHEGAQLARRWINQRVYSSPAIGDLDRDGKLDIVVGTGTHIEDRGFYVKVYNYDAGRSSVTERLVQKWHLTTSGRVFTSPALADLNQDGYLDIVAIANVGNGSERGGANNGSKVFAWSGRNGSEMFQTFICDSFGNQYVTHASPVIGEMGRAGESGLKILFSHSWEVGVLNANGSYFSDPGNCYGYGNGTGLTFWTGYTTSGTPAIGDIDGDGKVEVVTGGAWDIHSSDVGTLYVWEPGSAAGAVPWGMFRQNAYHTGNVSDPALDVSTHHVTMDFVRGEMPGAVEIEVLNGNAGSILSWRAQVDWAGSDAANWFTLSKTAGRTANVDLLEIEVEASKVMEQGLYVGTIIIEGDGETQNSPQSIRVEYEVPPPTLEIESSEATFLLDLDNIHSATYTIGIANCGSGGDIVWQVSENACWLSIDPPDGCTSSTPHTELTVDTVSLQSGDCLGEGWHTTTVMIEATTPGVEDAVQTVEVRLYVGNLDYVHLPVVTKN